MNDYILDPEPEYDPIPAAEREWDAINQAMLDGLYDDRTMPDPDAVDIRIGCDRDNEAEAYEAAAALQREARRLSEAACAKCATAAEPDDAACLNCRVREAEVAAIPANPGDEIATEAAICPTCGGSGTFGFDRNGSHAAGEYCEYACPTCHGTGRQSDAHSACEGVK